MKRFQKIALASALVGLSSVANADIIGGNVDIAYWQADAAGKYDIAGESADLEKSLGLEGDSSLFLSAAFEHPVPLLPNVKVAYSGISQSGSKTLDVNFSGQSAGDDVKSEWDLTTVDGTFYYEILDNWVNVDAGLTIRALDSEMEVVSAGLASKEKAEAVLPLLYGRAQLDLPFSGWSVGAELNAMDYDGDRIVDGTGYVQYEVLGLAHARAGYRTLDISVSDSGDSVEGDVTGGFIGVGVDF